MDDLETWVIDLLKDIKAAADKNENFDLHMEAPYVKEVAYEFENTNGIEIY